jgi:hypothetical protein
MSDYLLLAVAIPIRFLYRIFIFPLDRRSSIRSGAKFARDITEIYAHLLTKYDGKVIPILEEQSFDYV